MEEAPTTSADSVSTDSTSRLTLGIDVGKKALETALLAQEGQVAKTSVSNDSGGWKVLLSWLQAWDASPEKTHACMEASGGFEEAVATLLHEEGYGVSVVNPRRIKGYADSQLRRSKTDSADADLIARFGQREEPRLWEPPTAAESQLQELTRARQTLKKRKLERKIAWRIPKSRQFGRPTRTCSTRSKKRSIPSKMRSKSTSTSLQI